MLLTFILIVFFAVVTAAIFNRLIRYRNLMHEAFSGIDVQLKRRHDLIPNIVSGYLQYERKLLQDITNIRSQGINTDNPQERAKAESELSRSLKTLFAMVENYPDLKANKGFLALQDNLVEIEDQIQMARRYYNGTVRNYNILAESFPANLVAKLFGFRAAKYFEIEYATERRVPDVKF